MRRIQIHLFLSLCVCSIGKELTKKYIKLLVKYAKYKKRKRKAKIPQIIIDKEIVCKVDKKLLPEDAVFKSYTDKVVQDLIIKRENIKFKRMVYHSPSQKKTYIGKVPQGYEGEYGPEVNSQIVTMKYVNNMSIPKIKEFFDNMDIVISNSYISNRLTKHIDPFHHEKSELYKASLETVSYQQIDDTGCRVNGENYYTQIVCNELCTIFFTTKNKDRLTILDVLQNFGPRNFIFNDETFSLLKKLKISKKIINLLHGVEKDKEFNDQELEAILNKYFPNPPNGKLHRVRIMEASAIAYYHQQIKFPIVKVLVGDDAPQFKLLTEELLLCWIHDGRHYKRLKPVVPIHEEKLYEFLTFYWLYYRKLLKYMKSPSDKLGKSLSSEFDVLFSTKTDYDELDR